MYSGLEQGRGSRSFVHARCCPRAQAQCHSSRPKTNYRKVLCFAQRCDRFSPLAFSTTERVPNLKNAFSESYRSDLSENILFGIIVNLLVVEESNAEKRSHPYAKPKRSTVHGRQREAESGKGDGKGERRRG